MKYAISIAAAAFLALSIHYFDEWRRPPEQTFVSDRDVECYRKNRSDNPVATAEKFMLCIERR